MIDAELLRIFPEMESQKGHAVGVHEIFDELPRDPGVMTESVIIAGKELLANATRRLVQAAWAAAAPQKTATKKLAKATEDLDKRLKKLFGDLTKRNRETGTLDREFD